MKILFYVLCERRKLASYVKKTSASDGLCPKLTVINCAGLVYSLFLAYIRKIRITEL
jgi:hypothetical protein